MPPRKKIASTKPRATVRTLWVPEVNNRGGFGRWAFIEITDPWDAKNTIRAILGSNVGMLFQVNKSA